MSTRLIPDAIDNSADIIDSRDVEARIEYLTTELTDANEADGNNVPFLDWLSATAENDDATLQDAARELLALESLRDNAASYCPDWHHGAALIADSYFEDYARDVHEDINGRGVTGWPYDYIDWERAAEALKMDYASVDFDGVTYWVR